MRMDEKWIRDTGLVFATLFLILGFGGNHYFLWVSLFFLVCLLLAPKVLTPIAWVWFKLTLILGFVMNRVFFGLVFFVVILPIGLLRHIFVGDVRDLVKQEEKDTAFITRDRVVNAEDITKPY